MRWLILMCLLVAAPARAVEPGEMLTDRALETRAREISKGLRCVVCRNQSIDDSNAGIARDMRLVLRERLLAGDSDAEAVDYIVARYGTYVLLAPPVTPATWPLWAGPGVLLVLTTAGFAAMVRGRRAPAALSEAEREEIARLLKEVETG